MHVASGAAAGALLGSRRRALAAGPLLHLVGDLVPHQDIASRRFEIGSGLAMVVVLAATRGPLDPAVFGAAASSAPDLEHVFRLRRLGRRKLFPTHRFAGWHKSGGVRAWIQLLVAGAIFGATIVRRRATEDEA
jgi:hypothetical protein